MTRRILLIMLLLTSALGAAQCTRRDDVIWAGSTPANNATVYVGQQAASGHPPSPLANVYSDSSCSNLITQPLHSDAYGNIHFYAPCGQYLLDYALGGTYRQIPDYPVACTSADGADLGSPPAIGTTTPNAVNATDVLAKTVNGVGYVARYSGADCAAKAIACLASNPHCRLDTSAGTTCGAITVPAGKTLDVEAGTWNLSATLTLNANSSLVCPYKGTNEAPTHLREANGANLAALVHIAGDRAAILNCYLDGNYSNQTSAQDGIWVDNAQRIRLDGAEVHSFKRYGIYVTGQYSCCGRIIGASMIEGNKGSNLYFDGPTTLRPGPADWMIGSGSEFENSVSGWGIEAYNTATLRANHIDVGGNHAGGIKVAVTGSGVSNIWQLSNIQFGNNYGHDFFCDGSAGADKFRAANHILTNLAFTGLHTGATSDASDSVHLHDCGGSTIVGNYFAGGAGGLVYHRHYFSDYTSLGALGSVFNSNTFNAGGATQDVEAQGLDVVCLNSNSSGGYPLCQNLVLGNGNSILASDENGQYFSPFGVNNGSTYVRGNGNSASAGKYVINVQPNPGYTTMGMYGTGVNALADVRLANAVNLQWLSNGGDGLNHTTLLVDSSNHTYLIGNPNQNDILFQPTPATTDVSLVGGQPASFLKGLKTSDHFNQSATGKMAGHCAMSAGTSCTFTLASAYSGTPICIATAQGSSAIAGACSVSGTTVTVTAASSNSLTWGAMLMGDPN